MKRALKVAAFAGAVGLSMLSGIGPAAAQSVPYTDPAVTGFLGFCDAHGHSIQSGSLDAIPFAAKVLSSVPAKAPYDAKGSSAFLNAYQPRQGLAPSEWSAEQLISPAIFSKPAHPTVVGTKGDISMRQFVQDFPPTWDGFVQLRMFIKPPTVPFDPLHYAATDIQISGNGWHVVRGGNVPCSAGAAKSVAAVLAPSAAAGKYNQPVTPLKSTPGVAPSTAASGDSSAAAGAGSNAPSGSASPLAAKHASGSSFPTGLVVLGVLVVVLAAALVRTQRDTLRAVFARDRDTTDTT